MSASSLQRVRSYAASLHQREQRLQTIAVYGALVFIALIVVGTLPHRLF